MTGGELLAWFRQDHLSQQQLADLVNGSRSMIAQIELGTRQPSGKLLAAISQVLGLSDVERAMLFFAHGKVEQGSMLPYVLAALRLDDHLSPDQAEALVNLVVREYEAAIN